MAKLTAERLRELIRYDPDTGVFIWLKPPTRGRAKPGAIAGSKVAAKKGGWRINYRRYRRVSAGRLAFLYMKGRWPVGDAEHEDRDRTNNRWVNLREATRSQNHANRGTFEHSAPFKGVSFDKQTGKWRARIRVNYVLIDLGRHETPDAAHAAYVAAARQHFGEFARSA